MANTLARGDSRFIARCAASVVVLLLGALIAGCAGVVVSRPTGLNASLNYFVDATESTGPGGITSVTATPACADATSCRAPTAVQLQPPMRLRVLTLAEVHNRYAPSPTTVPTLAVWPVPSGVWGGDAHPARLDAWDRAMLRFLHGSASLVADCGDDANCRAAWASVRSNADYCDMSRYLSDGDGKIAFECSESTVAPPHRVRVTSISDVFAQPLLRYPQYRELRGAEASRALLCANVDGAPTQGWNEPVNGDMFTADGARGGPDLTFSVNVRASTGLPSSRLKLGGGNWQFAGDPPVVSRAELESRPQLHRFERDRAAQEDACLRMCNGDDAQCRKCRDAGDRLATVEAWTHVGADMPVYLSGGDGSPIDLPICTSLTNVAKTLRMLDGDVVRVDRDCKYWKQEQLALEAPRARSEEAARKTIARAVAKICIQPDASGRFTIEFSDKPHKQPTRIDRNRVILERARATELLIAPDDILEIRSNASRR